MSTKNNINNIASHIKLLAFDLDGVMTDGSLYIGDTGEMFKQFNSLDGQGIKLLHQNNIHTAIITKRKSESTLQRARELNIEHVYQACSNKLHAIGELMQKLSLTKEQVAYVGDDLPDLAAIHYVGLGVCVANANSSIVEYANYVTTTSGGKGAIREVCDMLLTARGDMQKVIEQFLQPQERIYS